MKEVNSNAPCFTSFGHFVEDIQSNLGSLRSFNFVHVKRGDNLAAHGLACEATTHIVDITWMEEILDVIYNVVGSKSSIPIY